MWTRHYRKSRLRYLVIPCLSVALLGYFGFHVDRGNHGLTSNAVYEARLAALEAKRDTLIVERERLEKRTAALRDGSLQRDMIDEQARRHLGMVRGNEIILLRSTH